MIEFIGLCVCSACLSCICCLITGGLCLIPCSVRLRNKIIKKHFSDDINWFGNPSPCKICVSDTSSSECSLVLEDSVKTEKTICKIPDGNVKKCAKECSGDVGEVGKKKKKKNRSTEKTGNSKPKRWTFCLNLKKPSQESSQCCVGVDDAMPTKLCDKKGRKKARRGRRNDSETYCAYFKSCSCTNIRRRQSDRRRLDKIKKRCEPATTTKCPTECCGNRIDIKRRSKISGNYEKPRRKCPCEILAEYENIICYDSPRNVKPYYCKCCGKK